MKEYKVILLDIDDTLMDFCVAEEKALEDTFNEYKLTYNKEKHLTKYRRINKVLWKQYEEGVIESTKIYNERFIRLFENEQYNLDYAKMNESYLNHLAQKSDLLEGAQEVVEHLASKYKLAIVTNGNKHVQLSRMKCSPLQQYIEHIIISSDVGYAKPHKAIFDRAFELLGHQDKSSVLMVGDSLTADIAGGNKYGIDTCWLNMGDKVNVTGIKPTYEIYDIRELIKLI